MPAHFVGRERDLAVLDGLEAGRAGSGTAPLVVVSGPGGVGKTALASCWLRSRSEEFPDGQLYTDLLGHSAGGQALWTEAMGQFLRALGVTQVPSEPAERVALWRSVTAPLRLAVLLDNAFSAAQVRPLLLGGQGSLVAVTSRYRLTGLGPDGAGFHQLGPLAVEDAVALLSRGIGPERVRREPAEARRVVALCAGLPLAVCLAAARLASRPRQPVRAMARALEREAERLSTLAVEGDSAVRAALDESYAVLGPDTARLYRLLGLLPVRVFETGLAAAVGALAFAEAERLIDALVEGSLVEDAEAGVFRFHDLVRLHAAERCEAEEPGPRRDEALRRAADWYLATATAAQRLLTPAQATMERTYRYPPQEPPAFEDESAALGWLDARRADLLGVVRMAADRGWDDSAWMLVDALWPLFQRLRYYELWIEAHRLGLSAARRAGRRAGARRMLTSGAIGLSAAGRLDDAIAWYQEALRDARESNHARDEGQSLLGLGACHREAGRPAEAVPYLRRAVAVWEGAGYPRGAALARIVLGELAELGGEIRTALGHYRAARDALAELPEPYETARAQAFLGRALAAAGQAEEGLALLGQALTVFEETGATHWQARTLEMLGESAERSPGAGRRTARGHYERSLALFTSYSADDAERVRERLARLGPDTPGVPDSPDGPGVPDGPRGPEAD
ncbi:tetratricopeptide repeat protein [Streptomyces sp. YIM 98790]|uniref:tetratricopeptide repeat protein n=1 Tax=Streptomyces sp. YIM 98790 TaxID=2689077 RepID=UPI0028BE817F|nr:tetratricopeptide repeat protein [Streptomyces sp. YIM 98790]